MELHRSAWIFLAISLTFLNNVTSVPVPEDSSSSLSEKVTEDAASEPITTDDHAIEDLSLLGDEAESFDERLVQGEESKQQTQEQQTVVHLLPSVEALVENEIWQYRYPPFFDNVVNQPDNNSRVGRFRSDHLPSYVIGILDPAELVDGLFQQQQPFVRRDSENDRNGKSADSTAGVPKVILDADDRWVWSKALSR